MKQLQEHALELVVGVAVIACGAALAYLFAAEPPISTVGAFLTAIGGVLCSWVAAKVFAREKAQAEFSDQLGSLSRALGQIAGQISNVVEQAQNRQIHPATAFALVSQGARMIYGQVNEIAVLQGEGFNSAYLIETASKLNDLARQLEGRNGGSGDIESVRREIATVRSQLASKASDQEARSYLNVQVPCPHCTHTNSISVGNIPGDSATNNLCPQCGAIFNVHRRESGVFTRQIVAPDGSPSQQKVNVQCPTCSASLSVRKESGRLAVCLDCSASFKLDATQKPYNVGKCDVKDAMILGKSGARPRLRCDHCGRDYVALLAKDESFFAICTEGKILLRVSRGQFEAWKLQDPSRPPAR